MASRTSAPTGHSPARPGRTAQPGPKGGHDDRQDRDPGCREAAQPRRAQGHRSRCCRAADPRGHRPGPPRRPDGADRRGRGRAGPAGTLGPVRRRGPGRRLEAPQVPGDRDEAGGPGETVPRRGPQAREGHLPGAAPVRGARRHRPEPASPGRAGHRGRLGGHPPGLRPTSNFENGDHLVLGRGRARRRAAVLVPLRPVRPHLPRPRRPRPGPGPERRRGRRHPHRLRLVPRGRLRGPARRRCAGPGT